MQADAKPIKTIAVNDGREKVRVLSDTMAQQYYGLRFENLSLGQRKSILLNIETEAFELGAEQKESLQADAVKKLLAKGLCLVKYKKMSGEVVTRVSTTHAYYIPGEFRAQNLLSTTAKVAYYDVAQKGWRSFLMERLESCERLYNEW